MRQQSTVLVLGAGASKEFGLPLGSELKRTIASDLNLMFDDFGNRLASGSYEIVEALRLIVRKEGNSGDINPHRQAAVQIASAMGLSGSIDEYVERHSADPLKSECAKLGIAKAILDAERKSKLFVDHTRRMDQPLRDASGSWLVSMLRDLTRGKSKFELAAAFDNLFVVNFNYDRCFEHLIYLWLQQMYDLSEAEAADISKRIKIFHPYGKLADLPFENPSEHIAFGGRSDAHRLVAMSRAIKTYSEAVEEGSELLKVRSAIGSAQRIVFLGFGFHQQNIDLLSWVDAPERPTLRCYATIDGIPQPRWELCQSRISSAMKVTGSGGLFCEGFRGNCEDFWNEYSDVIIQ